jgi:hypothetical protein
MAKPNATTINICTECGLMNASTPAPVRSNPLHRRPASQSLTDG